MSMKSVFVRWIGVAISGACGHAFAQEAIPTAAGLPTGAPPTSATSGGPIRLPDRIDDGGDYILRPIGPCGAPAKANGKPDRAPHGEVFAGVGTHGYREGGGIICVPIGDKAAVTVAVDAGRIGDRGRRR